MRAEAPLNEDFVKYTEENDAVYVNLGDSRAARRIMEGTREARDIVTIMRNLAAERKTKMFR